VNVRVGEHEVDALFGDARVIVETDGFQHHGTRAAFERDRARDARLAAAGYRVLRLTHRRIAHDPEAVAADLRAILAHGRAGAAAPVASVAHCETEATQVRPQRARRRA